MHAITYAGLLKIDCDFSLALAKKNNKSWKSLCLVINLCNARQRKKLGKNRIIKIHDIVYVQSAKMHGTMGNELLCELHASMLGWLKIAGVQEAREQLEWPNAQNTQSHHSHQEHPKMHGQLPSLYLLAHQGVKAEVKDWFSDYWFVNACKFNEKIL